MRVSVAAIGRLRGPEQALIDDYSVRIRALGRKLGVNGFEIREFEAPKTAAANQRRNRESALLLEASASANRIVLDERGENLTSTALAGTLAKWRDGGAAEIAFLIGGADGHDAAVLETADLKLAFGKATFPHLMVRLMVVEQIYRAMTILAGHPYHRA